MSEVSVKLKLTSVIIYHIKRSMVYIVTLINIILHIFKS